MKIPAVAVSCTCVLSMCPSASACRSSSYMVESSPTACWQRLVHALYAATPRWYTWSSSSSSWRYGCSVCCRLERVACEPGMVTSTLLPWYTGTLLCWFSREFWVFYQIFFRVFIFIFYKSEHIRSFYPLFVNKKERLGAMTSVPAYALNCP